MINIDKLLFEQLDYIEKAIEALDILNEFTKHPEIKVAKDHLESLVPLTADINPDKFYKQIKNR